MAYANAFRSFPSPQRRVLAAGCTLIVSLGLAGAAWAADAPVVRQVESPAAAPAPAAARPAVREGIGDITRGLLAAQADGRRAGTELPILGDVASASYRRYVDSFTLPIPAFFEETVEREAR